MNKQEIFDKVKTHLLTQNDRARRNDPLSSNFPCAYRGDNGMMCAIGCLIPDAAYSPNMEGDAVGTLMNEFGDVLPRDIFCFANIDLLHDLQMIHDNNALHLWASYLTRVAVKHGLSP